MDLRIVHSFHFIDVGYSGRLAPSTIVMCAEVRIRNHTLLELRRGKNAGEEAQKPQRSAATWSEMCG
jgi:hypothetical protein